jgi:hypothetical protein
MLNEVLSFHKPGTWDSGSYGSQRYRKVQVFGEEYSRVIGKFESGLQSRVQMVYRVQNPYLYGRYKLKVEQLQLTRNVYEVRILQVYVKYVFIYFQLILRRFFSD